MGQYVYKLKDDQPDERDYKFCQLITPHPSVKIPSTVDLRSQCPPVFDQGILGSCTANAGVCARMMLTNLKTLLSRLDLYYEERMIEGTVNQDSGASMRDICKALNKFGVCEEEYFPYEIEKFTNPPTEEAVINALKYKINAYHALGSLLEIKQNIALRQQPVLIGMEVYESMESETVENTGKLPLPKKNEKLLGGHAVLVVGYTGINLIIRNSWGPDWGDKGYFYMTNAYFKRYTRDYWSIG